MISPPGNVAAPSAEWSNTVSNLISTRAKEALEAAEPAGQPPPFYNPLEEELEATMEPVTWSALSGTLRALDHLTKEDRWRIADQTRIEPLDRGPELEPLFGQDEYCEWSVERDAAGDIARVTFTSEVREWFDHLAAHDRPMLRQLYKDRTGEDVGDDELLDGDQYNWLNKHNTRTDGPIIHLAQRNNNLDAAIALAAEAAVMRTRDGADVTDAATLMECGGLGAKDRFSDPSIATTINGAVARGARITLADPPGLYLLPIRTEGMRLPAGNEDLRPSDLWTPELGAAGHVVRARFEAPNQRFPLSEVLLDGRPIETGAQLAERVDVQIRILVHEARQPPMRKPCHAN